MGNISRRNGGVLYPEPLVMGGLSHSVNLRISFLKEYNLKLICTEEEVSLESPVGGWRMS